MLWGAIIGDIVGPIYEFHNIKTKDFPFFSPSCSITDDSYMTIAVAAAIDDWKKKKDGLSALAIKHMREKGTRYPHMGYGHGFARWLMSEKTDIISGVIGRQCVFLLLDGMEIQYQK
jgi:type I restriction enzyme M protein